MTAILWDIVIQPLVYLIEFVFSVAWTVTHSPGGAIISVSIAVNLLCLPLYKMADDAQERERQKQKSMERWVTHIKKTFHGDEQYMMLSAYYAEQGYRPLQALVGSLSLLLQIPFFMAAYSYLSNLHLLGGTPFLFMPDLGLPDGLLQLGDLSVNVLPILMTLLNCASTFIYTRGLPLRDKVQAYGLAAVFLVLLYDSPSGLVFYWTCNQLFSIIKNVFMKYLPHARRVALVLAHLVYLGCAIALVIAEWVTVIQFIFYMVAFEVIWWRVWTASGRPPRPEVANPTPEQRRTVTIQFAIAAVLLTVLLGMVIPLSVMGDSPTEFVDLHNLSLDPMSHMVHATCVWAGTFIVWTGTYFLLSGFVARRRFARALWCLAGICLVGFFVYGQGLGTISNSLVLDTDPSFPLEDQVTNLLVLVAVAFLLANVWNRLGQVVVPVLTVVTISLVVVSAPNYLAVRDAYATVVAEHWTDESDEDAERELLRPVYRFSRTERNVMVIFLDRAISCYLPYIMQERPELAQKLDGFTYYPNTISFGTSTNYGAPALFGGYEYTPAAMNAREDELIADKHNESLLVLPLLFSGQGYTSTITDPPYAGNYEWYADLSLYDQVPNAQAQELSGRYTQLVRDRNRVVTVVDLDRRFFCYGIFKTLPKMIQADFYDGGNYLSTTSSDGPNKLFINEYSTLMVLPEISEVDDGPGSFVEMTNNSTHEPCLLQLPDYTVANVTDNTGLEDRDRFTVDGRAILMNNRDRLSHYHVNAGTLLRLGEWFDWMRAEGVYDNTRIIIVSDHGRWLYQFPEWRIDEYLDVEMVNPLFMVKDFDAHGFATSDEFMTNADAAVMAVAGVIDDPRNPFTGVPITNEEKTAHDQLVTASRNWRTTQNNGTVFDSSDAPWYAVHDNIFDLANWRRLEDDAA